MRKHLFYGSRYLFGVSFHAFRCSIVEAFNVSKNYFSNSYLCEGLRTHIKKLRSDLGGSGEFWRTEMGLEHFQYFTEFSRNHEYWGSEVFAAIEQCLPISKSTRNINPNSPAVLKPLKTLRNGSPDLRKICPIGEKKTTSFHDAVEMNWITH